MVLLIVLLAGFGLVLTFYPALWWQRFEPKKTQEETAPSKRYVIVCRVTGILLCLAALLLLLVQLLR